jgi:hypothetical protein
MQNLASNTKIAWVLALIASANNTDSNTAILDMSGWDGVVFITAITTATTGAVVALTVESNAANSDSGMAAITGAVATKTSPANGTLLVVDVYRPQKRYVQGVITSLTQVATFGVTIAIQYKGIKAPVTADATIAALTAVVGS